MKSKWNATALAAFLALVVGAQAQSLDAVKKSMLERKPEVEQQLAAKTVGENNAGFLETIGRVVAAVAQVVEAENADRKAVYTAIAAKNGTDVVKVGQLRAKEIAAKAKPGTMLQGKDGKWAEKQ